MPDVREHLISYFKYDPATGEISSRLTKNIGRKHPEGYWRIGYGNKDYLAHRLAWLLYYGRWPVMDLDHINGDKLDNRIANLREANASTQALNSTFRRNGHRRGKRGRRHA